MDLPEMVRLSIDATGRGELEHGLMLALGAVDGTAARAYPDERSNRTRFVRLIDEHLWLIEPMLALGVDLQESRFEWVVPDSRGYRVSFSRVVYEMFRCNLMHGTPLPPGSGVHMEISPVERHMVISKDAVALPVTLTYAMLALVVFSARNAEFSGAAPGMWLTHARMFVVSDWWGREADLRAYFEEAVTWLPRVAIRLDDGTSGGSSSADGRSGAQDP